jgi:predicted O-linked N-acetylglucosamine transferase (SPINDLY family)
MNQPRPGRNDPCPCGSGRKFKRCCDTGAGEAAACAEAGREALLAGLLDLAIEQLRRAVRLEPARHTAHANLAVALERKGLIHEALASHHEALRHGQRSAEGPGLLLNYRQTVQNGQARLFRLTRASALDAPQLFAEHRRFGELCELHGRPGRREFPNLPAPERRLRVGYVSPDFRKHSIAHFFEPIVAHHDRGQVEVYCYYSCPVHDEITRRLAAQADHWIECLELPDEALAQRIEADGIDILVDLAGHTTGSRLCSFVFRPAPLQVSYLGYPATSGLRSMDYRLTDAVADPPGLADACFTERPLRLEGPMLAYHPGYGAGGLLGEEEPPLPEAMEGPVRFGSFNELSKLNAGVYDAWAAILRALPEATLTLKSRPLQDAAMQRNVAAELARRGVAPERLRLLGRDEAPLAHLQRYGEVDIALDPFPYNGVTTSFEALWMGVPVISLAGASPAARMGATIATHLGHAEWIAATPQEYVDKALALAADPARRQQLRRRLREELKASSLMDGPGFARRLEAAYRGAWRQWCAQAGPR